MLKQNDSVKSPIEFILNGKPILVRVMPDTTLLRYLRDDLHLTGTKNGCSTNHCGACMVLVDGRPTKSCLLKVKKLAGKKVTTIEGLSTPGKLSVIQAAFLAAGAVQCGFCTPGMIVSTHALLQKVIDPTEEEIRTALKDNICRCTGYVKIIDAVKLSARWLQHPEERMDLSSTGLSQPLTDTDGAAKVKGSLPFADDLYLEDMLYGKIVWSEYPHAEILAVETKSAKAVAGVAAVLTAKDVPGLNAMGLSKANQPVLCSDRVRFVGDMVAVVFAETPAQAKLGAGLVKVSYRELPGVFFPSAALQADAPLLHPQGNIVKKLVHEVGDITAGFKEAQLILEGHFETPFVEHAYLEPEAGVGFVDEQGMVTVKVPTQSPFELRQELSVMLGIPEDKVRVIVTPLGGGFGSKQDNTVGAIIALGAYRLGRPVKVTLSREESLRLSTKRHPYEMDYRVGFDASGHLVAVDTRLLSDAGPYTALSPLVNEQACVFSCGPYRVPNFRVEGTVVFTNNANSGAFRGFGINQVAVAIESILDECARRLDIDPFELRLRNVLKIGDQTISGEVLKESVAIEATIQAAQEALAKELPTIDAWRSTGRKIGVGVASGYKNVGRGKGKIDKSGAIFILQLDGRILLRASAVDMGQGIRTALLQIAAEVLDIPETQMDIITGDTRLTIQHTCAVGQRQTLISGKAVELAAKEFRSKLLTKAASITGIPVSELFIKGGVIQNSEHHPVITLGELAQGETIQVEYTHIGTQTYALWDKEARRTVPQKDYRIYQAYAYTTQVAIVEVDPESGKVKVLKVIAVHDCGRAINPLVVEGQIEGSCLMGIGYALSEGYFLREGRPLTRTYKQLGVPTFIEAPPIQVILIEDPEPSGPFGAKGISEVATVPMTPAVLNAIFDAIGVRFYRLPVRPEHILQALNLKK
jgi:CO/xanthine dehydrogenase Mo-binding subunit/aerobic-type carbon monoxide dehydrogenase small subunit (CoxS/CutS family)